MQTLFSEQTSKPKPKHSPPLRKEANLNAIIENFDGYVWSIDTSFEYIILNTALRNKIKEILGVDAHPGDKVMDILEAIDPSKSNTWSLIYQAAFTGESQRFVDEFRIAGKPAFFDISVNPIRYDETITGLSCFARDITEELMNISERKKVEKIMVHLQNQLMEEKLHRQQEVLRATIEAAEKEREEIGRELHDNVTQILTTARLCLSCIDHSNPARQMIDRSSSTINSAIEEIRNLSRAMIQSFHSEIGMKLSIENLLESINLPNKFQLSLSYYLPDEQLLDDKLKMTLFRIIQEQINNIIKHAEATEISILLRQCEDSIDLSISDNGKGFNVFEKRKGIGITNIINRADLFSGQVHIDSSLGNGCRIEVSFPR